MNEQRTTSRAGFTAIEILIVVAIIALLMSIAAGAVFRVKVASERSATETTLTKLASILDRHWKAVIDSAKKEYDGLPVSIKQNLITLADNVTDSPATPKPHPRRDDRARLLYVKFRLKQEFPTSFENAVDPDPTFGRYLPPTAPGTSIVNRPATATTGKPAYIKFIADYYAKLNTPISQNIDWNTRNLFPSPKFQSAILLVLALEQSRSGVSPANMEQEIGTTFVLSGLEDADAKKAMPPKNITLPRYLADTWGGPLQLNIFPSYVLGANPGTSDLDVTYSFKPSNMALPQNQALQQALQSGGGPDPQDPEGLLLERSVSQWNSALLSGLLHPQQSVTYQGLDSFGKMKFLMRRMVPTIISAGPDGLIGGILPNGVVDNGWAAVNPTMTLPAPGSFDNIYSFRLRQTGARGD